MLLMNGLKHISLVYKWGYNNGCIYILYQRFRNYFYYSGSYNQYPRIFHVVRGRDNGSIIYYSFSDHGIIQASK